MAITKVTQFTAAAPTVTADWAGHSAHIAAFIQQTINQPLLLTEWDSTSVPAIAQGCYLNHGGTLYIVDTADFSIATGDLSASGDYYIKLTTSGDTLTVEWEDDITGYTYDFANQGLYSGSSQILPYLVNYSSTVGTYVKYKFDIVRQKKVQNLAESDSPVFDGIYANTTANFLPATTWVSTQSDGDESANAASTRFVENRLSYMGARTKTTGNISGVGTYTIPAGLYYLSVLANSANDAADFEIKDSSSAWVRIGRASNLGGYSGRMNSLVISDGTNARINNLYAGESCAWTLIKIGG